MSEYGNHSSEITSVRKQLNRDFIESKKSLKNLLAIGILALTIAGISSLPTFAQGDTSTESIDIVGGEIAPPGSHPFMVSIRDNGRGARVFICGGSTVAPRWVMTAGHCVFTDRYEPIDENRDDSKGVSSIESHQSLLIGYGSQKLNEQRFASVIESVKFTRIEPGRLTVPDQALLRVDQDLPEPIELSTDDSPGWAEVSGWGETGKPYSFSNDLLRIQIPILTDDEALPHWQYDPIFELATGLWEGGKTPCYGDSGGGLIRWFPDEQRYKLVGVVSMGDPRCNDARARKVTIYSKFRETINKIKSMIPYNGPTFRGTPPWEGTPPPVPTWPTATPNSTATSTDTPTFTPTATEPPTGTPVITPTATDTAQILQPTATDTAQILQPTATVTPTLTVTPSFTPITTLTPKSSLTAVPVPTETSTATPTQIVAPSFRTFLPYLKRRIFNR